MVITDVLRSAQGGAAIANLAKAFGVNPDQVQAIIEAVVPRLSENLERNTLSRGGLADLVNALGHGHHEAYVDDPRMISDPIARDDGNAILSHILGTKDRSRAIADKAADETGVSSTVIKAMLPVLAGMMMGGLSKQVKNSFGDILNRVGSVPSSGGNRGGVFLPKQPLPRTPQPNDEPPTDMQGNGGTGGWGQNQHDGNVRNRPGGGLELPDSLPDYSDPGRGRGQGQGRSNGDPLPMPGNRVPGMPGNGENPYGDLAEILRRGLGLPGGSGPVVIQLPGGGSFPFPFPGSEQGGQQGGGGQRRTPMPQPAPDNGGGGFPWPQGGGGQGGGLPMPGGGGQTGGFPWPQDSGQGGGMGGGQGSPLPMPGGGGGGRIELPGGQVGGGMLWNIIRTILGSALGFQSKGIMSWLIRMVVMKYGMTILRTILGRGLFGR